MQNFIRQIQWLGSVIPPLYVLALCLIFTVLTSFLSYQSNREGEKARFERTVHRTVETVEGRIQIYKNVLIATRSYFQANPTVSRQQFHDFVLGFQLQQRYPGIQGLGYTVRLKPHDLRAHIQKMRKEGFKDYKVWPENPRDEYFSIVYLEPFDWRNQRAFGFDMFTEPIRKAAMERARDTGEAAASGKVVLVQETKENTQVGFLIYIPVYKKGAPVSTVEERRKALEGFVYSPFRAGDLFQHIAFEFEDTPRVYFSLYDGPQAKFENLIFDSSTLRRTPGQEEVRPQHQDTVQISVADHTWTLQVRSTPDFEVRSTRILPFNILFLGTVISFLLYSVLVMNRKLLAELESKEKSQEEIVEAHREADEANRAKSRFLANMSHEIRTPLGVMIGFTDLSLDQPGLNEDLRSYLRAIKRNGQQLLTLIGEVLDLSKIEANKLEIEILKFSLPNVLEEIISSLQLRAREKNISLIWDQSSPIPECIQTDPTKFRQILINLIGNAIKFTEQGEVRVAARMISEAVEGEPIEMEISVEDSGIGMSAEQQSKLFQAFTQADASTTRKYGGTGLGLALSQHLAKALGGAIQLKHSEVGRGSVFALRLRAGPFEGLWKPSLSSASEFEI